MKKLVIFGAGKIGEAVAYYFERDSDYEICAYACDEQYIAADSINGKPVIGTSRVVEMYPPEEYEMFVAVGYQGMNKLRSAKVAYFRSCGYKLARYVSPHVKGCFTCGDNSIVMDDVAIQPHVTIGDNVFVWGGAMIGHHTVIGDNCWLTGSCAIGGLVTIGGNCFIGLNATVGHGVKIGTHCMLGAGTLICRSIGDEVVLVAKDTEPHRLNSDQFTRLSTCFRM